MRSIANGDYLGSLKLCLNFQTRDWQGFMVLEGTLFQPLGLAEAKVDFHQLEARA